MTDEEIEWLRSEFLRCRQWIQSALDRDIGTHTIDDVLADIESGRVQLWPLPNSAIVSLIDVYPRMKLFRFWLVGGNLRELLDAKAGIEEWAKSQGCTFASWIGRRGWIRALPDYTEAYTVGIRRL